MFDSVRQDLMVGNDDLKVGEDRAYRVDLTRRPRASAP